MAAGASVTWTHCSVLFEVTRDKTRSIRADTSASVWTLGCVRADAAQRPRGQGRPCGRISLPSPLPPSLPPLPSPLSLPPLCCPRGRENKIKKNKNKNIFFYKLFLVLVAGLEREKKISIFNFRFSIPKIPKIPKILELRELRGQSRKKKKVFSA
jgi:hypothetical protein